MMLMIVKVFVPGDAVGKIDLSCEAAVRKDLHRSVNGRVPDPRIVLPDDPIDILNAAVSLVVEERFKNELTMRSEFELLVLQVFQEDLHLGNKSLHGAA
jgi:hypothetical protein